MDKFCVLLRPLVASITIPCFWALGLFASRILTTVSNAWADRVERSLATLVGTVLVEHVVQVWLANVLTRVKGLFARWINLSVVVNATIIVYHNVAVLLDIDIGHICIVDDQALRREVVQIPMVRNLTTARQLNDIAQVLGLLDGALAFWVEADIFVLYFVSFSAVVVTSGACHDFLLVEVRLSDTRSSVCRPEASLTVGTRLAHRTSTWAPLFRWHSGRVSRSQLCHLHLREWLPHLAQRKVHCWEHICFPSSLDVALVSLCCSRLWGKLPSIELLPLKWHPIFVTRIQRLQVLGIIVPWLVRQVHFLVLQKLVEEDFPGLRVLHELLLIGLRHVVFLLVYMEDLVGRSVLWFNWFLVFALHVGWWMLGFEVNACWGVLTNTSRWLRAYRIRLATFETTGN